MDFTQTSLSPPMKSPLACNLQAISAAELPRYNDLVKRLRIASHDRRELSDGYSYQLDTRKITLPEVAEWITMERLCCPFLTFQLDVNANGDSELTLRGPAGAKAILNEVPGGFVTSTTAHS